MATKKTKKEAQKRILALSKELAKLAQVSRRHPQPTKELNARITKVKKMVSLFPFCQNVEIAKLRNP